MLRSAAARGQAQRRLARAAFPPGDGRRRPGPGWLCVRARARLLVARGLHENLSDQYQERFIPFDRHVLLSMLEKKLSCIPDEERDTLPAVLSCAEASTMKHYYSVLEKLVTLYEPINPDRDTLPDLSLDGAIKLEQEKVFLKNLAPVLEQANFNTLSDDIIQYALSYHDPLFKSQVIAEIENYEYVKFWALGLRPGAPPMERQRSIESYRWWPFSRMVKAPMHRRYCKRVLMAARVRGGSLAMKSFKDIPLENLESLLPAVRMHIPLSDRTFLYLSLLAGGTALFANLTVLGFYNLKLDLAVLLLVFGLLMVIRWHRLFQRTRDQRALDHAITLYTKSTSNNGDMLVSLVHRAQQEHLKELILAHGFSLLLLLHQAQPRDDVEMANSLTSSVSEWLQERSGLPVIFNGARALTHLRALQGQRNGR